MPTQTKIDRVNELKEKLERCSIAIATDYSGISVNALTELRQRMRAADVEFMIVKNTLTHLAAEAAGRPQVKEVVQGPTALSFGYDEPVAAAKAVADYIRINRSPMTIRGAVLGDGQAMPAAQVVRLASLPSKPQLVANLLGQMQAPLQRLLAVLNGPLRNLDALLQARIRQLESSESGE